MDAAHGRHASEFADAVNLKLEERHRLIQAQLEQVRPFRPNENSGGIFA
jgi:hypothetical protein